jgi:hypothetical protein
MIIISVLIIFLGFLYSDELEFTSSRKFIQKHLNGFQETKHFKIYYAQDINKNFEKEFEFQYLELVNYFKINPRAKVSIYIYKSPEQKARLMGARDVMIGNYINYEMHLNYESYVLPYLKHELAHVLSSEFGDKLLKSSYYVGLVEGLAEAVSYLNYDFTLHEIAKAQFVLNVAPDLGTTLNPLGFWTKHSAKAYILCGSFVKFLIDKYSIELFKKVYAHGNFKSVYKKDLKTLIDEYKIFLGNITLQEKQIEKSKDIYSQKSIFERTCAREISRLNKLAWKHFKNKDYKTSLELFTKILSYNSSNKIARLGLILTHYNLENFDLSIKYIKNYLIYSDLTKKNIASIYNLLGNNYLRKKENKNAEDAYKKIIELNNNFLDEKIEAQLKIDSINCDCVNEILYKNNFNQNTEKINFLLELDKKKINKNLTQYLLGILYFETNDYNNTINYFIKLKNSELDTKQYLGEAYFFIGDYNNAKHVFHDLLNQANSDAQKLFANSWLNRIEFYKAYESER